VSTGTLELARILSGRLPGGAELEAIRLRRLRALADYAYRNVPYYRTLFLGAGIEPRDLRSVADLRHLPVSTREQLRAAGRDSVARGIDLTAGVSARTSGSSGRPWTIYRTHAENRLRRANDLRSMRLAGVRPTDVVATLGPLRDRPVSLLRMLGLYRTEQVSPLLPVEQQIERLRAIRPSVFWVYPSALRALVEASGALEAVVEPRLLITSAEPFDDVLRHRVGADRGGYLIRNFYGSVEIGRIAWQCGAGTALHVNADCVILELEDDLDVAGAGKSVVATNLNAHTMPFIRYRLGDLCATVDRPCPCGVPLPLIEPPVGRDWDVIRLPSGRLLSPWGYNVHLRSVAGLLQFRVVQKRLDHVVVVMRFAAPPAPSVLAELRGRLEHHTGEGVGFELELVDAFEESGRLKFRSFISELGAPAG
jgi:phenylacetate-CoA ligase